MSHSFVAMEIRWALPLLMVLFSVDATHFHSVSKGLSCVNDFVNNVSCTWLGSTLASNVNCSITGVRNSGISSKLSIQMIRSCKLEHGGNSPPGCSFVFENKEFNRFKDMPYISMECDGMLMENLTNYKPHNHIKMNPPGVPEVNTTANDTFISWSAGSPRSIFITSFDFHVQIKQVNQPWKEAYNLSTNDLRIKIPSWKLKGHCQVRVRVYPMNFPNSHWSNWSPTTLWVAATDTVEMPWYIKEWLPVTGAVLSLGLVLVVILVVHRGCISKKFQGEKPVPNPSKYFHTLHSVHEGNLKTWLNPTNSFFMAQPSDHISSVEVCDDESSDAAPSTSPSSFSTNPLLQYYNHAWSSPETTGTNANDSSSSSSFFSNIGYFLSNPSSSSAQTDPIPAYFIYRDEFNNQNGSLSLCPSITSTPAYESLKQEPQSPDSGFGFGKEYEEEKEARKAVNIEEVVFEDNQICPLFILPLHPPLQLCSPPSPLPPPAPPAPVPGALSTSQVSSEHHQVDSSAAADSGSCAAAAICRSLSMHVEPSRTGYLTLKDLQTTFSNKSI